MENDEVQEIFCVAESKYVWKPRSVLAKIRCYLTLLEQVRFLNLSSAQLMKLFHDYEGKYKDNVTWF